MPPSTLLQQSLTTLRATRKDIASAAFRLNLGKKPIEDQRNAALHAHDVENAILALQSADLANIRDKLVANEAELIAGINDLNRARANLAKVEAVIGAAGRFLDVLSKVVTFAATRGLG